MQFKVCKPDANTFPNVVKFKNAKDIKHQYVSLDKDIGYWILQSPFENDTFELYKELVSCFPISKDNNRPDNPDPNPFDTIHIPDWLHKDICLLLRDFYIQQHFSGHWSLDYALNNFKNPRVFEWGNVYYKDRAKPIIGYRIPHIDYPQGMVGNLWFTNHEKGTSGTKFYKYIGNKLSGGYDFAVDPKHKLYDEYQDMLRQGRNNSWFNFDDKELQRFGFEYLGMADCVQNTMTVYKSDICHLAYVEKSVNFRWSHTYAFAHG
tara:strand:- start:33039 stop:33827 length:789 start_codon:yes stop_codon:yes gene_type:complete